MLVLPVELIVSEEPLLCFLCFILVLFMLPESMVLLPVLLPVPLVDVFCAKTAQTGRSERPRVAIMIFFIWGYVLIYLSCSTLCFSRVYSQKEGEGVLKFTLNLI